MRPPGTAHRAANAAGHERSQRIATAATRNETAVNDGNGVASAADGGVMSGEMSQRHRHGACTCWRCAVAGVMPTADDGAAVAEAPRVHHTARTLRHNGRECDRLHVGGRRRARNSESGTRVSRMRGAKTVAASTAVVVAAARGRAAYLRVVNISAVLLLLLLLLMWPLQRMSCLMSLEVRRCFTAQRTGRRCGRDRTLSYALSPFLRRPLHGCSAAAVCRQRCRRRLQRAAPRRVLREQRRRTRAPRVCACVSV